MTTPHGPHGLRHHHFAEAVSIKGVKAEMAKVDGFNAKVAVFLTNLVGSMWCAYLFAGIALLGLAPALKPGGSGLIPWIAQTFLQLVLLSVIMVGQSVQGAASDSRAVHTFEDTERLLDLLDAKTAGGIKVILDAIEATKVPVKKAAPKKVSLK